MKRPMPKSNEKFIHVSKRESFLFGIGLFIIALCTLPCNAQWKLIHNFGDTIQNISSIYFIDNIDTGNYTCLVGFNPYAVQTYGEVWRTTNGGIDWQLVFKSQNEFEDISAIDFKDRNTGWLAQRSGNLPGLGGCYKTADGGNTWTKLTLDGFGVTSGDDCRAVYYNKTTGRLFLSRWDSGPPPLISSDEGNSWKAIDPNASDFNGFAFINDQIGIASTVLQAVYYSTIHGGISWTMLQMDTEAYQPTAFGNSFYAVSEYGRPSTRDRGVLLKSSDFGSTWQQVFIFPFGVSGCVLTDSLRLYIQGIDSGEEQINRHQGEGIFYSQDSGFSWIKLCGTDNNIDTRFYVKNGRVWIGDRWGNLWFNSTGIGSNSTPQFTSITKFFKGLGCNNGLDSILTFTFFDSCNNIQPKLDAVFMSGSANFSFSSPSAIPRTIHPNDSLIISYNPASSSPDTAQLHLRFHVGWKDFDTVISLFGAGRIPKETVRFVPSSANYTSISGGYVDVSYMPNKNLSGRMLDSISFDLIYNGDLLHYRSASTSIPGATITAGPPVQTPFNASLPIMVKANNISLDSLQAIVQIQFEAMVTTATRTPITMTNLQLNGGDANYANCVLSADTMNSSFTLSPSCGDSSLRGFLKGVLPLKIISLRPNPAQDEIELDLQSVAKQDASVEIYDALGTKVFSDVRNLQQGTNSIWLETKTLSSGVYLVRLHSSSEETSQSFVKAR